MVAPAVEGIDLFKIAGCSISGWIPSLRRSARNPGSPGNGVPATLSAAQPAPMGRFHLHLAYTAGLRPNQFWPGNDGLPDEVRHDSSGMVV